MPKQINIWGMTYDIIVSPAAEDGNAGRSWLEKTVAGLGRPTLLVLRGTYVHGGSLALEVYSYDSSEGLEPFATLTVNIPGTEGLTDGTHAFLKDWSENEGWAPELARLIGGKPTDTVYPTGYVTACLWDFSGVDWEG